MNKEPIFLENVIIVPLSIESFQDSRQEDKAVHVRVGTSEATGKNPKTISIIEIVSTYCDIHMGNSGFPGCKISLRGDAELRLMIRSLEFITKELENSLGLDEINF